MSNSVEIAFFSDRKELTTLGPLEPHEAALSRQWKTAIRLTPILSRARRETAWAHYVSPAISLWDQQKFHQYSGPEQAATLASCLQRNPDVVLASQLPAMGALLATGIKPKTLLFDLDDLEHVSYWRAIINGPLRPGKVLYASHIPAILLGERRAIKMADSIFVCSEQDRRHLQRIGMGRGVHVIPNALAVPLHPAPNVSARAILYLGTYGYQPNCDAADRLIRRIWPLVQAEIPDATLLIAGNEPFRIASFSSSPAGVTFTGFVENLDDLYASVKLIACPLEVGTGTRLKLIEAASYGKPIVSTRVGAEGLDFHPDTEIVIRESDRDFSQACIRLLGDDAECARIGLAARLKMMARYDAAAIKEQVVGLIRAHLARSG